MRAPVAERQLGSDRPASAHIVNDQQTSAVALGDASLLLRAQRAAGNRAVVSLLRSGTSPRSVSLLGAGRLDTGRLSLQRQINGALNAVPLNALAAGAFPDNSVLSAPFSNTLPLIIAKVNALGRLIVQYNGLGPSSSS